MPPIEIVFMAATPSTVVAQRCLWQRHQAAACSYCLDACPTGAIEFVGREVQVDQERCLGCGVCLAVCPVECFETQTWSERSLVSTLARLPHAPVEIACRCHPAPQQGDDAVPVLQAGVCLAALSPGLWFEIGLEQAVCVRMEYCAQCPLSGTADYTRRSLELANAWLESSGRPPRLTVQTTVAESSAPKPRVVVSAERPILNRRDFLFGFARSSGSPAQALACLPAATGEGVETGRIPPYQPAWLRQLAAVYPAAAGAASEECAEDDDSGACACWPAMQVAENCTACGACARYCPSGALSTAIRDGLFEHHFVAGVCVACGLCAEVCGPGALARGYAAEPEPFTGQTVAQRAVQACRKCGGPALAALGGLCYWCANEPSMRSLVDDARSLFHIG